MGNPILRYIEYIIVYACNIRKYTSIYIKGIYIGQRTAPGDSCALIGDRASRVVLAGVVVRLAAGVRGAVEKLEP